MIAALALATLLQQATPSPAASQSPPPSAPPSPVPTPLPPAGTVLASATLQLTGDPLDAQWLQARITDLMQRETPLQPGATATFNTAALPPSLPPGASALVPVNVQIDGGAEYSSVSGTTDLTVQNVAVAAFAPPLLFYDDDPEKIVADGVLFRGKITPTQPVRLYYYHENTGKARRLIVALTSDSQDPTSVQVIDSSAGPNADVLTVGHDVTRGFLEIKPPDEGTVIDVPQTTFYALHDAVLQPMDAFDGTIDLRVLGGGAVVVTVMAAALDATPEEIAATISQPQLPGDGHHRTGVFDLAGYTASFSRVPFTVGADDASIDYGAQSPPPAQPNPDWHDYGEYGVWRTIEFDLSNPAGAPATVYLYETPQGGVLRSSFLVDGQLDQVRCARLPVRYEITSFAAPPGQSQITVQTMTDGGSSYPVEVGLTTTPPQPTTPPLFSADGCFPKPPL